MTLLEQLIANKQKEVDTKKRILPVSILEQAPFMDRAVLSMARALASSKTGIIAEHKRRSPSKAMINTHSSIYEVVTGYQRAGAAAVSVLTDTFYFGGSLDDLSVTRELLTIPVIRKDFMIDPYQVFEAKAYGADAILLITAALNDSELTSLSKLAKRLGLEVLIEVHDHEELERALAAGGDMIGVNNRNLKTFEVSTSISRELAAFIPTGIVSVSESGINSATTIGDLRSHGYKGFLIGEYFMNSKSPSKQAADFIEKLTRNEAQD